MQCVKCSAPLVLTLRTIGAKHQHEMCWMLKVLLEMVELGFTGRFYNNKTRLSSLLGVCLSVSLDKFRKPVFTDKMFVISDLKT
ncbi:MAG: hypothetical protein ACFN1E_07510 [Prevotella melaninogenica]